MLTAVFICIAVQLKKTMEELAEVMAEKEELAQRCQELDIQVCLCLSGFILKKKMFLRAFVSLLLIRELRV